MYDLIRVRRVFRVVRPDRSAWPPLATSYDPQVQRSVLFVITHSDQSSPRRLLLVAATDSLKDGSDRGVDVLDVVGGLTVANEVMHDTSDETANGEGLVVN